VVSFLSLTIDELRRAYREGSLTPTRVIERVLANIEAAPQRNAWITRLSREQVMNYVHALEGKSADELPLYGIPFAIKDNIDLAGAPTSAACPEFAYVPQRSATVVQKLIDAGAIPVGKTNLDQFATGLVGTRSPYGPGKNSFNDAYISGGSSSGSAIAVATGLVSFALGTDTAGSGRVPAAFNNIVGLKPSCGLLSTRGVVPACRSLDCVSIFALTSTDASRVLDVAKGFDAEDAYSRELVLTRGVPSTLRMGVPRADQSEFFGDAEYARLFEEACERARASGADVVPIDFSALFEAARLLYEGPWVAERYAAVEEFIQQHPDALYPVTARIIAQGNQASAVSAFKSQYRLKALQRSAQQVWKQADVLMVPSAGTIYRIDQVDADPIALNSNLGRYTNFVNLLDMSALAIPAGFRGDGLPFGITLIAPAARDYALADLGSKLHEAAGLPLGTSDQFLKRNENAPRLPDGHIAVAVCGAHMSGLPLNPQLTSRHAFLLRSAQTSATYRFYALPGGPPKRPGLVRVDTGGAAIDVEVWAVPAGEFGSFVAGIPSPLGIGKVELEDGSWCSGFVCESWGVQHADEITRYGGWRQYLASGV
jgi:allophanate hydrolase